MTVESEVFKTMRRVIKTALDRFLGAVVRTAVRRRLIIATCGIAALTFVCLPAQAEPITSTWLEPPPAASKKTDSPADSKKPQKGEKEPAEAAKVEPEDLVSTGPRKEERDDRPVTLIRKAPGAKPEDAATEVPEIPWELIELALQQQNQAPSAYRESEIIVSREYHQLIIDSLPDFALDIAYAQPAADIPILDFLRTQTSALSVEIATYTSDFAVQDDAIAMASNGNLDSDDEFGGEQQQKEGTKLPSLLKKLFFWGLGLLVLYTVMEALISKLVRRDFQGPVDASRGGASKAGRFMRKRGFGRSRSRHSSA